MATLSEIKRERVQSARALRRLERTTDTALEKVERRLDTLIDNRKSIITVDSLSSLIEQFNAFTQAADTLQRGLADFVEIVNRV